MMQGKEASKQAEIIIKNEEYNEAFCTHTATSSKMARELVNSVMEEGDESLTNSNTSYKAAVKRLYFILALACANLNAGALPSEEYILHIF